MPAERRSSASNAGKEEAGRAQKLKNQNATAFYSKRSAREWNQRCKASPLTVDSGSHTIKPWMLAAPLWDQTCFSVQTGPNLHFIASGLLGKGVRGARPCKASHLTVDSGRNGTETL